MAGVTPVAIEDRSHSQQAELQAIVQQATLPVMNFVLFDYEVQYKLISRTLQRFCHHVVSPT